MKAASSSSAPDKNATFGQRLAPKSTSQASNNGKGKGRQGYGGDDDDGANDAMEISWVPSASVADDDEGDSASRKRNAKRQDKKNGIERFGAGMEKGGMEPEFDISEVERSGRKHRRHNVRSGSKNAFRRMGT